VEQTVNSTVWLIWSFQKYREIIVRDAA